ncbi:MAG: outer membrane beta-barrel protein [Gemmatimonadetes bacterium]|nr:outer membrane beta-barrel protein [Gemmatimonadota bacterium]
MPHARVTLLALALLALVPAIAAAQTARRREVEPYQWLSFGVGLGGIAPIQDPGFEGDAGDAESGVQLALGLDVRRGRGLFFYARADADAAKVRQHLGAGAGLRFQWPRASRLRPYAGGGVGILWLEPKVTTVFELEREFALRGEAFLGSDWTLVPGLQGFAEYRLVGARYTAVSREQGCDPDCFTLSQEKVLHLGHTGWVGLRIKLF